MVGNEQMAARFCVSHQSAVVDVRYGRHDGTDRCDGNDEFSGNKSSNSKSSEKFENGVKN